MKNISILLAEDNPGDARLMLAMLKESTRINCSVILAKKLSAAETQTKKNSFDSIILDLNLPDSKGLVTLDHLIETTGNSIPVIILTGIHDEEMGIAAIEQGAEDYLVKGGVNLFQIIRSIRYSIER